MLVPHTTAAAWPATAGPTASQSQIGLWYELELELIQSHMAQKPMLRGEVGARALRVRSDVRGHGQVRLCKPSLSKIGKTKVVGSIPTSSHHEGVNV